MRKESLRLELFSVLIPMLIATVAVTFLAAGCGKSNNEPPAALNPAPAMRKAFIVSLKTAGEQVRNYAIQNGHVPEGEGVEVPIAAGLRTTPRVDPWGNAVRYKGKGNHYSFSSAGPDKQWGTKDDILITDADTPF